MFVTFSFFSLDSRSPRTSKLSLLFRDRLHISSDNTLTWCWRCKKKRGVGVAKQFRRWCCEKKTLVLQKKSRRWCCKLSKGVGVASQNLFFGVGVSKRIATLPLLNKSRRLMLQSKLRRRTCKNNVKLVLQKKSLDRREGKRGAGTNPSVRLWIGVS